ncbi:MAG: HDIG domain-containing protein [Treponema sp.]|jgi:putative nucleotidyltransferase with HDIG domain|nr:HDIG domain-containing protein [Treponema sp.]
MKNKLLMINTRKITLSILSRLLSGPNIYSFVLCVIAAVVIVTSGNDETLNDISIFEAGKVADRDITATAAISVVDEEATLLRLENAVKQIPAVFRADAETNAQILTSWEKFCDFADRLSGMDAAAARLAIDTEYHGFFSIKIINDYLSSAGRAAFRDYGDAALDALLKRGIFLFHHEDIRHFSQEAVELMSVGASGVQRDIVPYGDIVTMENFQKALDEIVQDMEASASFKAVAVDLLKPFVSENVFFSFGESQKRIDETKEMTAPVIRTIEKGKKIIRKGFIVSEDEMNELKALQLSLPKRDPRNIIGTVLLVLLIYILFLVLRGRFIVSRNLSGSEKFMLTSITGSYIIGTVLLNNLSPVYEGFPLALIIPTALFIMILAVFLSTRLAMIMAISLPLGAYFAGAFDNHSFIIALVSGITASTALHNAQNRMSIIKAGILIAAANCTAVIVVLLLSQSVLYDYPAMLFWAALNGIVSGMLTIGVLPPLEHALNAVTPFRLMELSDLNAPVLRKLFTTAPGTYSHSLMVANLAEQACQDIGANALLARVGAYYHDIGKMDNPDYFVENQTDHNRHDEIAPRLSATIIRSHVKLGVEKAHSLGLPKDVISIIAEHHGNSVISWFYNKAAEQEDAVSSEDFTYPGNPPRSRESAVVMLADVTEAAVRTLNKPTAGKIEKFIQPLFDDKVDHGQLSESELSFRDLEVIKKAFVKVLAGYYHSRIEYPKQKEESRNSDE